MILWALPGQAELSVVPAVQSWTPVAGVSSVKAGRIVVDEKYASELKPLAGNFKSELVELGCGKHSVRNGGVKNGDIVLTLDGATNGGDTEGYRIELGDTVMVSGLTEAGVFNGTRTLLQLLAQDKTNLTLPRGIIVDNPQYRHRMLMLDVGRKPFPLPVLKDYLKIMSWYKMNELHLHLSDEAFGGKYTGFRVSRRRICTIPKRNCASSKIWRMAWASPSRRRSTCPATRGHLPTTGRI